MSAAGSVGQAEAPPPPPWFDVIGSDDGKKMRAWRQAKTVYELLLVLEMVPGAGGQCWYMHPGAVYALLQLGAHLDPRTRVFPEVVHRTMVVLPFSEILTHKHDDHRVKGEIARGPIPTFEHFVEEWRAAIAMSGALQAVGAGATAGDVLLPPAELLGWEPEDDTNNHMEDDEEETT